MRQSAPKIAFAVFSAGTVALALLKSETLVDAEYPLALDGPVVALGDRASASRIAPVYGTILRQKKRSLGQSDRVCRRDAAIASVAC